MPPPKRHTSVTAWTQPSLHYVRLPLVKKLAPIFLLVLGLLFGGCAMSVPIDPSLLMLLMKDDGPAPTLQVGPKTDDAAPANISPAEVARDHAAAMG
jgi:hypothetical protein